MGKVKYGIRPVESGGDGTPPYSLLPSALLAVRLIILSIALVLVVSQLERPLPAVDEMTMTVPG